MEKLEYEISLRDLFHILLKRIWIVIIAILLAVIVSCIINFYILTPIYETSTTLIVNKPHSEENIIQYNDILLNQKLVKTYGQIVTSRSVTGKVINNLSLPYRVEELKEMIAVNTVGDTEIIEIKVAHMDPVMAKDIADELADVFMVEIARIMQIDNVQVIDYAQIPSQPVKPRKLLNIAIAAVLGMMIGLGLIFLLEYLDNSIKTEEDVERYLALPVIGAIPEINENTR